MNAYHVCFMDLAKAKHVDGMCKQASRDWFEGQSEGNHVVNTSFER